MNFGTCSRHAADGTCLVVRLCRDLGLNCAARFAGAGGSAEYDRDRLRWQ